MNIFFNADINSKVLLAGKLDKKNIKRFYKRQHYSASFIGLDCCFYMVHDQNIIAAVIISQITEDNPQYLLHGLVVDKLFRQQGLALFLLAYVSKSFTDLVCFADMDLSSLYMKANFNRVNTLSLTPALFVRYQQYVKKHNNLVVFALNKS